MLVACALLLALLHTLPCTSAAPGNINADINGNTFTINRYFGINTTPSYPLDVAGTNTTRIARLTTSSWTKTLTSDPPVLELLNTNVSSNQTETNNNYARIDFSAQNTSGTIFPMASIAGIYKNHSNATTGINGQLALMTTSSGTLTEALRIDENGNIGIGTSTPARQLHVNSSSAGIVRISGSTGGMLELTDGTTFHDIGPDQVINGGSSTDLSIVAGNNKNLRLYAGATERARIDSNGNLGIGTSTPNNNAVIAATTTPVLELKRRKDIVNGDVLGTISFTGNGTGYTDAVTSANPGALIQAVGNGTWGPYLPAYLTFSTTPQQSANYIERLRISADGNIGIGTTTPNNKLDVVGTGNFTSTLYAGSCAASGCTDIAELYPSKPTVQPGDVVCRGTDGNATRCDGTLPLLGIISTHPAIIIDGDHVVLGQGDNASDTSMPIALKGRVPVKVECPVRAGDYLVPGSTPGYAMALNTSAATITDTLRILGTSIDTCTTGKRTLMVWLR